MPEHSGTKHKPMRIGLLGAAFDTGNMGVSALAESSIKCILHQWPDAEVTLLDSGRVEGEYHLKIDDQDLRIRKLPIRFCKNLFLENHFIVLCLYAFLFKVFRWVGFKRFCTRRNASLYCITQMDMVADITGGDSFSDIYGMRRFMLGFLRKWLVLLFNKDLVMLPQTYGPFQRLWTRLLARYVLRRCKVVSSRDQQGLDTLRNLLGDDFVAKKARFSPDIAFILDARRPNNPVVDELDRLKDGGRTIIGLNVSGLLYNGGYTQDNMFGLRVDYPKLMTEIIRCFTAMLNVHILLVPHVFPADDTSVESDPIACKDVYHALSDKSREKVIIPEGNFNQGQIKYLIGQCDFFVGSRMHSCIAALSQGIPTVGIAYSSKFQGVFASVGCNQFVVDMRQRDREEILDAIAKLFQQREFMLEHLKKTIPMIRSLAMDTLMDMPGQV